MKRLLDKLGGGDRRSIGHSNLLVAEVSREPALFAELIDGLSHHDQLVRMRSADAIEKISANRPAMLQPYKQLLIDCAATCEQKELRWHMAQICPRLYLTASECRRLMSIMIDYLNDPSRMVKTFAMQAMLDLAKEDKSMLAEVTRHIKQLMLSGSPAMRSRGRQLLAKIAALENRVQNSTAENH